MTITVTIVITDAGDKACKCSVNAQFSAPAADLPRHEGATFVGLCRHIDNFSREQGDDTTSLLDQMFPLPN